MLQPTRTWCDKQGLRGICLTGLDRPGNNLARVSLSLQLPWNDPGVRETEGWQHALLVRVRRDPPNATSFLHRRARVQSMNARAGRRSQFPERVENILLGRGEAGGDEDRTDVFLEATKPDSVRDIGL